MKRWLSIALTAFLVSGGAVVATDSPAQAAGAAKLGVHEDPTSSVGGRTPSQVRAFFGSKAEVGRAFVSGVQSTGTNLVTKFNALYGAYESAGYTRTYISVKLQPSQVTAGTWDTRINALGDWICDRKTQDGHDVRAIYWHEPEDDLSASSFAGAMTRFTNELHQGCSTALSVYSAMAYQWRPGSSTTSNPGAWRNAVADDYEVDVYSGRSFDLDTILPEHPGFARWHAQIPKAKGVWWGVTERGWEINGSSGEMAIRAETMEREFAWLKGNADGLKCKTWIGWNSPGVENSPNLTWNSGMENRVKQQFALYG